MLHELSSGQVGRWRCQVDISSPGIPCDKTLRVPLDRMQSCNQGCCLHPPAAGPVLLEDDGHVIMSREVLELSSRTLEVGLFG